jgi:signal transduction histidine kinase
MDPAALEAIQLEAERMSRMVNDLLLLARADNGELKLDLFPIDLDTVVLHVYEQSRFLIQDRRLDVKLGYVEPVRVHGNTDRLVQLLLNLVSNAVKFTPDGGRITLSVYPQGEHAILEVSDTGRGIHPDDLPRIFDRFYQADHSRAHHSNSDGAGLGLSIAKWIVEAHGGAIEVRSALQKGTTFTVRLPAIVLEQRRRAPAHTPTRLARIFVGRAETEPVEAE